MDDFRLEPVRALRDGSGRAWGAGAADGGRTTEDRSSAMLPRRSSGASVAAQASGRSPNTQYPCSSAFICVPAFYVATNPPSCEKFGSRPPFR